MENSKASKLRKEMVEKDPSWVIDNSKASKPLRETEKEEVESSK